MKRTGLFVDTVNLFTVLKFKYGKRAKLSYPRYVEFLNEISESFDIQVATCMQPQRADRVERFYEALEGIGFRLIKTPLRHYQNYKDGYIGRKIDCDVALAVEILQAAENLDHIIIGTNDDDLLPVVERLKAIGKRVTVFACMVPDTLRDAADSYIEIPESLLESKEHEVATTEG